MELAFIAVVLLCRLAFTTADNVRTRFTIPSGYYSVNTPDNSFAYWLNHLPLKPAGTVTKTYRGDVARTNAYTAAVVEMSVGKQDLQQCADAVMRLRAEYLYRNKRYRDIAFNFASGFRCDYVHYAKGYRYSNGKWVLKAGENNSYSGFMNYMNLVFTYAGTLSLEKELVKVDNIAELKTGDVFIHGGSPGHCFIVMDVIEDATHQKLFLLAQSFMPAQDIQILKRDDNPWFSLSQKSNIPYGELVNIKYLHRFKE